MFFSNAVNFVKYLFEKRCEFKSLGYKDILMTRAILKIHDEKVRKNLKLVPLKNLLLLHGLDRKNALKKVEERIRSLELHKHELLKSKQLTKNTLLWFIPSVSGIKVIPSKKDKFVAFEGNGRIFAMQKVFAHEGDMLVEVEIYELEKPDTILKMLHKIRRLNHLEK